MGGEFLRNHRNQGKVGRKPIDAAEGVGREPPGGFVLVQVQGVGDKGAHVAVHCEVELGIVPIPPCGGTCRY